MPRHQHFVGIDLHESVIQMCVLDADGEVVHQAREWPARMR